MAYCVQCGAALPAGARYCGACGSSQGPAAMPPAPGLSGPRGLPPPAPPQGARAPPDTGAAQLVILVGAALSAALPILLALVFLVVGSLFAFFPFGAIPGVLFGFVALLAVLAGLLFAGLGLWARNLVRDGQAEKGGIVALGTGLVALVTGNFLGGLALMVGGFMAYTAR